MADSGRRWTVHDRDGNPIYLTEERWRHITALDNHPELAGCEEQPRTTLRQGRRRQEPLNPRKYCYVSAFDDLPDDFTHLVAIVPFGYAEQESEIAPNNFVATAFLKHMLQGWGMITDEIKYSYDEAADVLYISFAPGGKATAAVELNDSILLRFDRAEKRVVGLTLMDFSALVQLTEFGPRSFPLGGLKDLEPEWRDLVLELITVPPVNRFLKVSAYTPSSAEAIPIALIEKPPILAPA